MRRRHFLKLYEYEAKNILNQCGIPVPQGALITKANRAVDAVAKLEPPFAVKSQVLVAGRGKTGGILFADSAEDAKRARWVPPLHPRLLQGIKARLRRLLHPAHPEADSTKQGGTGR